MIAYRSIISARFRTLLQYRVAAIAGVGTQLFWGIIRMMVFTAFYESANGPVPMELDQVITYIWLSQATLVLLPWNLDGDIHAMIREGAVAYELLRPVDLYSLWYCRAVALRSAPMMLRFLPIYIIAFIFFDLQPPASVEHFFGWIVLTVGAVLVSSAITSLMNISMMWTIAGEGVARIMAAAVTIFAGLIIPLPLFPDWAQPVLQFMPFAAVMDTPIRMYCGDLSMSDLPWRLAHQIGWTVALVITGRYILQRGLRKLVIAGG